MKVIRKSAPPGNCISGWSETGMNEKALKFGGRGSLDLHKGNLYHITLTSTKSLFSHSSAQGTVFWSAKCSHPKVFDMEHQKRAWNVVESCNLEKDGKRVGFILVFGLPSATFTCRSRRAQAAFRHRLYRASLRLCEAGQRKHDSQLL